MLLLISFPSPVHLCLSELLRVYVVITKCQTCVRECQTSTVQRFMAVQPSVDDVEKEVRSDVPSSLCEHTHTHTHTQMLFSRRWAFLTFYPL